MPAGDPARWEIYWDPKCPVTNPVKGRYVIVSHASPTRCIVILIITRLTEYAERNSHLKNAAFEITKDEYSFLDHASQVDCSQAFDYPCERLKDLRGNLDPNHITLLQNKVFAGETVAYGHRNLILAK